MNDNTRQILNILFDCYPSAKCELDFCTPYELLVAVILSAQCTDKRVNVVTAKLFEVANTPQQLFEMPIQQLEQYIYSCGFYHNKAKSIKGMTAQLLEKYGGQVPSDLASLQQLDGVGRKTANVVYSVAFGGQAIAVDTHVFRVSNRLGLAKAKDVYNTEMQLQKAIDEQLWSRAHHAILFHGRYVCKSQHPNCELCRVKEYCSYAKKTINIQPLANK